MSDPAKELVLVQVKGLMLDPSSNVPIVILRQDDGAEFLPIWIGVFEANAIALNLEGIDSARPMTHDLIADLVEKAEIVIDRIVICDLEESTFFARVELRTSGGSEASLDARPSDAIALALRVGAPIFVSQAVFDKARHGEVTDPESDQNKIRKWLEEVDPEDLGKYTM